MILQTKFQDRHIDNNVDELQSILSTLEVNTEEELIHSAIPQTILGDTPLNLQLPPALSEQEALELARTIGKKNKVFTSLLGQGYHNTIMPSVIQRNIFENPGWYTSYTAYQSEISQGRLEALFNFQTLTSELTGLPVSNASLLDEGTAIAEAVLLSHRFYKGKRNSIVVLDNLHPQSLAVLNTRTRALNMSLKSYSKESFIKKNIIEDVSALVLQLPDTHGDVYELKEISSQAHAQGMLVVAAIDPMFLVLAGKPSDWGVDIVVGSFQRYGIPLGYGGPHAAYFSTTEELKRLVPGRIVGQSKDSQERTAYRFALQTREQHIRREKATSNICTSQALLAVLSSMYAVYHGPKGLQNTALRILKYTSSLHAQLKKKGLSPINKSCFDTVSWDAGVESKNILQRFLDAGYNVRCIGETVLSIAFDECITEKDYQTITKTLHLDQEIIDDEKQCLAIFPPSMLRSKPFLSQKVFNRYHTETEMMRYIRKTMDKDLALDRTMIPLGSCTMKLNAASELIPLSWKEFSDIHPFAPLEQTEGYQTIITELEQYLCRLTGYDTVSLQPNAGSQGEYAGLLAIIAYHKSRGESQRDICFIPSSAHGTNPASAHMANLSVVIITCDKDGNIDTDELHQKAKKYSDRLAGIMITYPSTHGVYESKVKEICKIVHEHGAQVYIDGANLNALVGLVSVADLGADLSHLNLHKTFAIPHGGGGPGVGPIGVKKHLAPFLPYNMLKDKKCNDTNKHDIRVGAISSAPWGSALILIISWLYIRMMGAEGMTKASSRAVINANYIATRLASCYNILYTGQNNRVAHECIVDIRKLKVIGISAEDIAKRLIDYGFHAPTMSWPVNGTLMIEPTESESKYELDRFCEAMIDIRSEIALIENGTWSKEDNPLVNAPHCAIDCCTDNWEHLYSRKMAAYPFLEWKKRRKNNTDTVIDELQYTQEKYWPPVSRIDNAYGDMNLLCTCPPIKDKD